MNRRFLVTAAVILLAVCTSAALGAQGRGMGRGGPGMGQRMGGPGGPDGRGGRGGDQRPGGIPFLQGIKLTEEQREQVRAIMEEGRSDTPPDAKLRELQAQLHVAILADAPDGAAIDALKAQISAAEAEMLARRVSVETRVAQILTAEQRAQARAAIGKHRIGGQ